jgi:pilus assembly protein Flp/PilA
MKLDGTSFESMKTLCIRFAGDESGVTSIEYALIATLIGMAIIVGAGLLGTNLGALYQAMADAIPVPA